MKNKTILSFVAFIFLCFILISCDNGTTGDNGAPGDNGGHSGSKGILVIQNSPTGGIVYICDSPAPTTYMQLSTALSNSIANGISLTSTDIFTYNLTYSLSSVVFSETGSYLVIFLVGGQSSNFRFKGGVSFNNGSANIDFNTMISGSTLPYN